MQTLMATHFGNVDHRQCLTYGIHLRSLAVSHLSIIGSECLTYGIHLRSLAVSHLSIIGSVTLMASTCDHRQCLTYGIHLRS